MQIFLLSPSEAADPKVWENLQSFIRSQDASVHISRPIGDDAPDVGLPPPGEVFGVTGDLPQQVFGIAQPTGGHVHMVAPTDASFEAPQPLSGAPFTAGAGQSPIAPAAPVLALPTGDVVMAAGSLPAPMPAPVAPAPLAPAAHPTPVGVAVDKDGLPWDARIHASTKTTNADGRWKAKRNVDPQVIGQVTAELRAVMGQPMHAAPAPLVQAPPPQPLAPVAPPAAVPPSAMAGTGAPPVTPAPTAPVGETFAAFMLRITPYTSSGQLTPDMLEQVGKRVGVTLPQLQHRPDLIPGFAQACGLPPYPAALAA